jgi:hypothetical protein
LALLPDSLVTGKPVLIFNVELPESELAGVQGTAECSGAAIREVASSHGTGQAIEHMLYHRVAYSPNLYHNVSGAQTPHCTTASYAEDL